VAEIGGSGQVGLAFETTKGTYIAPTKWIPVRSESLQKIEEKQYRMNIRALADRTPGPQGNYRIEGDIEFEITHDTILYFLYAARVLPAKTGVTDFTYTFTPVATANPTTASGATTRKTLSILVGRSNLGFGYTGLSVTGFSITFDNEVMVGTFSLMGLDESLQSIGAQTWPTSDVYGPEESEVKIPAATARVDISSASLTVDDGGVADHRMDGSRAPSRIRWGEREVTFTAEHDFEDRDDYDIFTAQTQQSLLVQGSRSATNDQVKVTLAGTITDSYDVTLPGLGDLVSANIGYHATYDGADAYTVEVKSTEDIT